MLSVDLHNILSEEEARDQIQALFERVISSKDIVAVTRGGHPVVALVEVNKLEELTGLKMEQNQPVAQPAVEPAPVSAPVSAPLSDLPAMPDMPPVATPVSPEPIAAPVTLSSMPMNSSPMPSMSPAVSVGAMPSNSPMSEPLTTEPSAPISMPTPPMASEPATLPAAPANQPVAPMPLQSHFGQDLPDSMDPSNGSPLS